MEQESETRSSCWRSRRAALSPRGMSWKKPFRCVVTCTENRHNNGDRLSQFLGLCSRISLQATEVWREIPK
jgi:hypothetical protein